MNRVFDPEFQSAPSAEAGRNEILVALALDPSGFNPLPALRPGGTPDHHGPVGPLRFQSAPSAEAGRNSIAVDQTSYYYQFQSAPSAEAGRNCADRLTVLLRQQVSIRSQRSGWEERD